MSDFEVVQFVKSNDGQKTFRKLRGNARQREDGGFTIYLDTIHGDVELVVQRKAERQQRQGPSNQSYGRSASYDDDVPFR